MKIPLIAPFAAVSLLLAACGQKSSQVTSSVPASSSTPSESMLPEATQPADNSETVSSSSATNADATKAGSPESQTTTSVPRPVFKSEAATQAANQYLDTYSAVLSDINAAPATRTTDPETGLNNVKSQLQKLGRDSAALANQQREVDRQLTPDEKKRLGQYQKNLEQPAQD
jgi:hypothetical protein